MVSVADHRADDARRTVLEFAEPTADDVEIVVDARSRTDLRPGADEMRLECGRRRAPRDDFPAQPEGVEATNRLREFVVDQAERSGLLVRRDGDVTGVVKDPVETEGGSPVGGGGECHEAVDGGDAGPSRADVEIDEDPERRAGGSGGGSERGDRLGSVDGNADRGNAGKRRQTHRPRRIDGRIGDEDVGGTVCKRAGEHLRLADLRHRQARGPRRELEAGDRDALVGLRVGTVGDRPVTGVRGHPFDVPPHLHGVEDEGGRGDRVEGVTACGRRHVRVSQGFTTGHPRGPASRSMLPQVAGWGQSRVRFRAA
jgi:hypothetical protein